LSYTRYSDLDVYKRAYALALTIHQATIPFPKFEQYGGMGDQIRRASKGICANMAEGLGRKSTPKDESHFLTIALGSVEEMRVWLQFAQDLHYIPPETCIKMRNEYEEIGRMIFALKQKRLPNA
jgi:four helix bundle protein